MQNTDDPQKGQADQASAELLEELEETGRTIDDLVHRFVALELAAERAGVKPVRETEEPAPTSASSSVLFELLREVENLAELLEATIKPGDNEWDPAVHELAGWLRGIVARYRSGELPPDSRVGEVIVEFKPGELRPYRSTPVGCVPEKTIREPLLELLPALGDRAELEEHLREARIIVRVLNGIRRFDVDPSRWDGRLEITLEEPIPVGATVAVIFDSRLEHPFELGARIREGARS